MLFVRLYGPPTVNDADAVHIYPGCNVETGGYCSVDDPPVIRSKESYNAECQTYAAWYPLVLTLFPHRFTTGIEAAYESQAPRKPASAPAHNDANHCAEHTDAVQRAVFIPRVRRRALTTPPLLPAENSTPPTQPLTPLTNAPGRHLAISRYSKI
jgi:hypothetical protein